jgi:hypothetical protein
MKNCHFITIGKERRFIPGCPGGAIYGYKQCTCHFKKRKEDRLRAMEKRLDRIELLLKEKFNIDFNE